MTSTIHDSTAGGCPIGHRAWSQQKTARVVEDATPAIERDAVGTWHVRGYEHARAVLRSTTTKQAGFKAELIDRVGQRMNPPILYQEGKPHNDQRKQTARFFTPKAVSDKYHGLMERYADHMIGVFQQRKQIDLSMLSMKMAVRVAGEVVGLTDSRMPGMDRRLDAFFATNSTATGSLPERALRAVQMQTRVAAFFYLDVKPAIDARRRVPGEDVISHLIGIGASDPEILTECITYGAAGMATTREFISVAALHLLEQPILREQYGAADEAARHQMLQEMLRLEPVVAHLLRRTTAPLTLGGPDGLVTIPEGSLVDLHINPINTDEAVVGAYPRQICPQRELSSERVGPAVMSFGDGAHRCPGAYIAIQETDIFLRRLLHVPGLRIVQKPSVRWHELITGYELRGFLIACD